MQRPSNRGDSNGSHFNIIRRQKDYSFVTWGCIQNILLKL